MPSARARSVRPDPRKRIELFLIGSLVVLSLVGGRLVQLQGLDRTSYTTLAEKQRLHTVALSAPRGEIVDRQGQPLAETVAQTVHAEQLNARGGKLDRERQCIQRAADLSN